MRFLLLAPFVPYPPVDGGRLRIYELMTRIGQHHDVDFLTLSDGSDEALDASGGLRDLGFDVTTIVQADSKRSSAVRALRARRSYYGTRFTSEPLQAELRSRLSASPYDVVQAEYSYMGGYRLPGRTPWILDEHNVEFRLNETLTETDEGSLYRAYARRERRLRKREEIEACRLADHVLTTSDIDRDLLRRELPDMPATVVPNGVDLELFQPAIPDGTPAPPRAVYVGKMDYRPNVDAMTWFAAEVLPEIRRSVPEFELEIVGGPTAPSIAALMKDEGVTVAGRVADTRPFLERATVCVVPLRAGSGTRLKVLESFAAGLPVVSTSLGCEGIAAADGRHLLVADSATAFATAVVRLLGDPSLRARLAAEARRLVETTYGWDALATRVEEVAENLALRPEARRIGTS